MRILWVKIGGLWPLTTGGRLRSFHTLAWLSRQHQVTLVTTNGPGDDPDGLAAELPHCDRVVSVPYVLPKRGSARLAVALARSWLSRFPVDLWKCRVPAVQRQVRQMLQANRFDLCVADFLVATSNVPMWRSQDGPRNPGTVGGDVPVVHFSHNVEHRLWQRLCRNESRLWRRALLEIEWRKMRRCEARACTDAQLTIAVSQADRDSLAALAPDARIRAITTGVDISFFRPNGATEKPNSLVFTGAMDWYPNEDGILDFIDSTLPLVRRDIPDASLTVVGRNPTMRLRSAAARAGVQITGTVQDVRPFVADAAVFVVPLRVGGGTRLKILEALAMGKSVVATTIGAEGLPLTNGEHFIAADAPPDFARALVSLLREPARRKALGDAGRQLVEQHHSWAQVAAHFEQLCKEVVGHAG